MAVCPRVRTPPRLHSFWPMRAWVRLSIRYFCLPSLQDTKLTVAGHINSPANNREREKNCHRGLTDRNLITWKQNRSSFRNSLYGMAGVETFSIKRKVIKTQHVTDTTAHRPPWAWPVLVIGRILATWSVGRRCCSSDELVPLRV